MKLSYRERVILIVVIVAVCLLGGFFGLVKPKWDEAKRNESALAAKEQERATIQAKLDTKTELSNRLRELRNESNELHEHFLPMMETYEIDDYMAMLIVKNNLQTSGLNISMPSPEPLNYYSPDVPVLDFDMLRFSDINNRLEFAEDNTNSFNSDAEDVLAASVTFTYAGKYSDLLNFIEEIRDLDKTIIVTSLSIQESTNEFGISKGAVINSKNLENSDIDVAGSLSVKLYMLPGMAEGQR